MKRVAAAVFFAAVLGLSGCGSSSGGSAAPPSSSTTSASAGTSSAAASSSAACSPSTMQTKTAGTLTIGADQPVYEPWFVGNDPTSGKGFEDSVAYAVAQQLGYGKDQVKWVRVLFDNAIQPGPKSFDMDLDEFSITPQRQKVVDFSSPYYDVTQAVIALEGTKAAAAKSVADLRSLRLGAQVGTTSYTAIVQVVKPSRQPRVYNTNDDAKAALQNGQIDGLVTDLPTAFYITAAQVTNGTIVGQLPQTTGKPEQFGILLDKDSPVTACVSKAVDALRANGTLDQLQQKWLAQTGGAPVLK